MRMGVHLLEEDVKAYKKLIEEFSDVFVWLYEDLKGIFLHLVEHQISLIRSARPIHQKKE